MLTRFAPPLSTKLVVFLVLFVPILFLFHFQNKIAKTTIAVGVSQQSPTGLFRHTHSSAFLIFGFYTFHLYVL